MILDILKIIPALASFFFIGFPFSYLIFIKSKNVASEYESYNKYKIVYGRILIIIISFYIGALISALFLIILSLLGFKFNLLTIIIFSLIFFIYSVILIIKYKRRLLKVSDSFYIKIENVKFLNKEKSNINSEKYHKYDYEYNKPIYKQLQLIKPTVSSQVLLLKDNIKLKQKFSQILNPILTILIIINILVVLFFAILFPIRFWDAISCWSLKAKAFFIDKNIFDFYLKHDYSFSAVSYPIFLPLVQTWIYLWLGKINENLLKIIFPIFYSSSVFLIFTFFYKKFNKTLSLLLAFIFATIPIIADHGYIEYSNLLFSIILFIAVYFFSMFVSVEINKNNFGQIKQEVFEVYKLKKYSHLYLSSIFFGILLLVRSEGIFYFILFLLINIFIYFYEFYKKKNLNKNVRKLIVNDNIDNMSDTLFNYFYNNFYNKNENKNKNKIWQDDISVKFIDNKKPISFYLKLFIKKIILPIIIVFIIYLPWLILRVRLNISFASQEWKQALSSQINWEFIVAGIKRAFLSISTELIYSSYDSTKAFFGSFYGPVLIILLILFFVSIKNVIKYEGAVFFLFVALVFILSFISIMVVSQFEGSVERYIMPAFLIAYFWILSYANLVKI